MLQKLSPQKKVALRLAQVSWWDRTVYMRGIPRSQRKILKKELSHLRRFDRVYLSQVLNTPSLEEAINESPKLFLNSGFSTDLTNSLSDILNNKNEMPSLLVQSIEEHLNAESNK